jgi:erythritol transport system substrate-binding protein
MAVGAIKHEPEYLWQQATQLAKKAMYEADKYIKTGAMGQSERQLIDGVLITPANADQFGVFGSK